jgi:hypothetical protein
MAGVAGPVNVTRVPELTSSADVSTLGMAL